MYDGSKVRDYAVYSETERLSLFLDSIVLRQVVRTQAIKINWGQGR